MATTFAPVLPSSPAQAFFHDQGGSVGFAGIEPGGRADRGEGRSGVNEQFAAGFRQVEAQALGRDFGDIRIRLGLGFRLGRKDCGTPKDRCAIDMLAGEADVHASGERLQR